MKILLIALVTVSFNVFATPVLTSFSEYQAELRYQSNKNEGNSDSRSIYEIKLSIKSWNNYYSGQNYFCKNFDRSEDCLSDLEYAKSRIMEDEISIIEKELIGGAKFLLSSLNQSSAFIGKFGKNQFGLYINQTLHTNHQDVQALIDSLNFDLTHEQMVHLNKINKKMESKIIKAMKKLNIRITYNF